MIIQKSFFLWIFFVSTFQSLCALSLRQQFEHVGYVELYDTDHGSATFDTLYAYFDELIEFLQAHPVWAQKLYSAKERFIRSKERSYYSTDFFGLYDESHKGGRGVISFYYSTHFHDFISAAYKEFMAIPQIIRFLNACREIQKSYAHIFVQAAIELELETIFLKYTEPPILFKVVKYLPSYRATAPHYDGTAFSLFLDSTDNQSLLLSAYKMSLTVEDFHSPLRKFSRSLYNNSIVLIPGAFLAKYALYPTPHLVTHSGKTRYATIAFAMIPDHIPQKNEFSLLPNF